VTEGDGRPIRLEPRWPVVLTIVSVLLVLAAMSTRTRLFPPWIPYAIGAGLVLPMLAVRPSGGRPRWLLAERVTTILFSVLAEAVMLATLFFLIH